jgi:penicillin amidase
MPFAAAVGSNNWAIGGSRTRTGRPIVANDPHLPLRLPGFWYQATLRGPGYEAAGVTLAGFPFIVLGQGRDVAWAFTNVMLDDHDLFFEQFDDTGDRVRRADGWLELTVSTEQIALPDGGTEELRLRRSDLGVVLEADAERGLPARSLAWTGATAGDPAAVFLQLARARSVEDLPGRLDAYVAPAQNLVVADRDGGLLYTAIGRVPERPLGDGRLPVPAWKPDYRWAGLLPQALNPTRLRPADGLIVTANHDIRLPDDSEAPVAMTADFDTPHRALRIEELLQASTDWTVEAMGRVQTDTVSLFARQLSELLAKAELSGEAGRAVALLTAWDGEMDGYGAAALAALVERELTRAIFADEGAEAGVAISPTRGILLRALRGDMLEGWFDDLATPEIEDRTTTLARAVGAAWTIANERWGPDPADWPYGESHTLRLDNPLGTLPVIGSWFNRGPISLPGSATTVAAFGGRWDGETYPVLYGPSMRWISDLSDPDASLAVLPAGQSGHPADPHYDDQLPLYLSGRLRAVHWSEEAIIDATRSVLVLRPASQ